MRMLNCISVSLPPSSDEKSPADSENHSEESPLMMDANLEYPGVESPTVPTTVDASSPQYLEIKTPMEIACTDD